MQGSDLSLLGSWQNFYIIMGTAAATLMGLMFVAMGLIVGIERDMSILDAGISAFNTPTVVHFGAVFLAAAILSAPWQSFSSLRLVLEMLGLAGVIYLLVVMRRMRSMTHYQTPLKDWLWYLVFPLASYVVLITAGTALLTNPAPSLYVVSAAMVTLLFFGIHNAWDLVTYFAVARSQSENTRRK